MSMNAVGSKTWCESEVQLLAWLIQQHAPYWFCQPRKNHCYLRFNSHIYSTTGIGTIHSRQYLCRHILKLLMMYADIITSQAHICFLVAGLVKGRGKAITETGIASMDLRRNVLRMLQFCDDQLYNQLMTKVHMLDPIEV